MFSEIRSVHFVGICGTAMASTAAALKEKGLVVPGSDQNVYPPMSTFLADRSIEVISGYAERNLAHRPDLVVIGNAISRGNPEAEYVLERKLRYCSLPELLKEYFIRGKRSLVVAGTHGKTTTTSLLTWVFEHNGYNPSYLIGGIPTNLGHGVRVRNSQCQVPPESVGRTQRAQRPRGRWLRHTLRSEKLPDSIRLRHLQRNQTAHGGARNQRRRHGRGRLWPSSDRHSRNL